MLVDVDGQHYDVPDDATHAEIDAITRHQAAPVGKGESLARGAAQGATMGFGDEIQGAVQALGGRVLPESMGGFGPDHHASLAQDFELLGQGVMLFRGAAVVHAELDHWNICVGKHWF